MIGQNRIFTNNRMSNIIKINQSDAVNFIPL